MIDWTDCPLVQSRPDYLSGAPTLRTMPRMTVDTVVECADLGLSPSEISEAYDVPSDTIRSLLDYAQAHRVASRPA